MTANQGQEVEYFEGLENHAQDARNKALAVGIGLVVLGTEITPRFFNLGLLSLIGAAGFELARRVLHHTNNPNTVNNPGQG